jgi:HEAT repeat protein
MAISTEEVVSIFRLHGDHRQRELILRLKRDGKGTFPVIKAICNGDYPPSVQRWAVEALGVYDKKIALPLLRKALASRHMTVRLHGLLGIGALGDRKLAALVRPLLRDESGGIRVNALAMAGVMKPRWLKLEAQAALRDEKAYVRSLAKRLLGHVA